MHARAVDHGVEVLEESTKLGTELAKGWLRPEKRQHRLSVYRKHGNIHHRDEMEVIRRRWSYLTSNAKKKFQCPRHPPSLRHSAVQFLLNFLYSLKLVHPVYGDFHPGRRMTYKSLQYFSCIVKLISQSLSWENCWIVKYCWKWAIILVQGC